ERQQVLVEWNTTTTDYPKDKCIHQLFEEQVERTPEAIALVFADEQLSYRELNRRANQLAHYLRGLGVGPEVLVGICVERSVEMVVGLLGILKAGGAYLPLDPAYPPERLSSMLKDAAVGVLLTQKQLVTELPEHSAKVVCLDADWAIIGKEHEENPVSGALTDSLAYVIYTSGSTGKPKGTVLVHQGLVNYLTWCTKAYAVADGCGAPVHSSIGFDAIITSLFSPLLAGKSIVLIKKEQELECLKTILCSERNFSLIKITPAHLDLLSQLLPAKQVAGKTRRLVIGGEAMSKKSLTFWRENAPETRLLNEYGPTETVVGSCVYEILPHDSVSGSVPIGSPIANTQIYLLDRQLNPVPIGVAGELHIGGDGVARGYLNRSELTAEKFIPNPYGGEPGTRLYRTGDLGRYLPDGNIEFLDRLDRQVKLRGYRIELGEIEVVLKQHPAVRQAVVVVREAEPSEKRLVAYLVAAQEPAPSLTELRGHLKQKLPEYMVPAAFVLLDELPLTTNGKLDRQALAIPDSVGSELRSAFIAPRDKVELKLTQIWEEVLNIRPIGVRDNFWDLGGHSLVSCL
ncbi:MAG TPA: amino acid adenylation domain-containing protein, partial [Ktedonobacteraceae bacterium]